MRIKELKIALENIDETYEVMIESSKVSDKIYVSDKERKVTLRKKR